MSNLDSLVDDFYGSNKPAAAKPAAQVGAAGIDANDNVRRFLDFLGQAEGADYDVIVGGSRFDDFSRHPNIVGLRTAEGPSTAAGKYQITGTTYRDFAPRLGINDFSPESQDRLALAIIESEGALEDVQAGNFDAAIQKLGGRWASLPSSPYSQPKRDQAFVDRFLGARQQAPARRRLEEAADTFLSTNQGAVEQAVRDQEAMIERGRGMGEFFADTGLAVAGGFGGLGELVGTGIGLVTGDMDNALRSGGAGLREWAQENQSKVMQAQKSLRQLAVESSEDEAGKFFAYLSETLGSPSLAIDFMAEQAPQLLVMGGAGRIAGGAAKAARLGAASAGTAGTAAAIGAGSGMQGLDAAGQAYDQIKALPRALQLQNATVQKLVADGVPEDEAIERAARAEATTAGFASGATSAALNLLPWASTLERALAGAGTRGGSRLAGAAKGFIGEGVSESLDEVGGVVAANYATQQLDPSQPLSEGVGEAAAAGALFAPFGGVAGAMQQPTPAAQPASEPATPKPNSPLQNAANAAAASAPSAAPAGQGAAPADPAARLAELEAITAGTPAQTVMGPNGRPMTIPGEQPRLFTQQERDEYRALKAQTGGTSPAADQQGAAPDPFAQRVAQVASIVEDKALISALRSDPRFGKESVTDLLAAYAKARNPTLDPLLRERALSQIEQFTGALVGPNTLNPKGETVNLGGEQGTAPGQSVVPASPAAGQVAPFTPAAPADDGMTLDGEFRTPSERMAGANPNQLAAPPVLGLPTEEALQARRDAEAAYDQAFQDLVKAEQLGASEAELGAYQRALFEADAQRKRLDAELAAADARVADARERESQAARRAILAGLIEQGVPAVNPVSGLAASFTAALQQQGYGNIVPTADEMRTIQRAVDVANAQGANVEPAAPNEMPAELVPARAPTVTPTAPRGDKTDEVVRLLSQGWKLNGKTLVSPRSKRRILNLKEQEAVRNAQKALRAGLDPVAALPGNAAQSEAQAALGAQGVVPAAPAATETQEGGVTDDVPTTEELAQEAQEAGGQEGEKAGSGRTAVTAPTGAVEPAPFFVLAPGVGMDERVEIPVWSESEAQKKVREYIKRTGMSADQFGAGVQLFDAKTGQPAARINFDGDVVKTETRDEAQARSEAAVRQMEQAKAIAQPTQTPKASEQSRPAPGQRSEPAQPDADATADTPVGEGDTFQWNARTYQLTKMPEGEGRGGAVEVTVWRDGAITPVNDTEYGFTREQFENATGRKLTSPAPVEPAADLQKSTEGARGEGTGIGVSARAYVPPKTVKEVDEAWRGVWQRGTTPNQDALIASVQKALDSGLTYNSEVDDFVAKDFGITNEDRQIGADKVQGGAFGYDVYQARKEVDRRALVQANIEAFDELGLAPGKKIGTVIFNDSKIMKSVEVESVEDDKQRVTIVGSRGSARVRGPMPPIAIKNAIDRAEGRGLRKPSGVESDERKAQRISEMRSWGKATPEDVAWLQAFIDKQRAAAAQPAITTALDAAAHEAATSPLNDLPHPTDEQKKAGNYTKGSVRLHGMDISIENPQGSVRSGTAPDGTRWENRIAHHYGYIKGSRGADNDQIDVFLTDGAEEATVAWVIDQKNDDGSFDEHKAVIGPKTEDEARAAYLANYDEGWDGLGAITSMPMEAFKAWALDGKRKRKALAYVEPDIPADTKPAEAAPQQEQVADTATAPQPLTSTPFATFEQLKTALKIVGDVPAIQERLRDRNIANIPGKGWVNVPNKLRWDEVRANIPVRIETYRLNGVPARLADVTLEVMESGAVTLKSRAEVGGYPDAATALRKYVENYKGAPEIAEADSPSFRTIKSKPFADEASSVLALMDRANNANTSQIASDAVRKLAGMAQDSGDATARGIGTSLLDNALEALNARKINAGTAGVTESRPYQQLKASIERLRDLEIERVTRGDQAPAVTPDQSTHKDPGQPAEPVTQPVIAQAIQRSARNTAFDPAEAKAWILGEIDRAIAAIPERNAELAAEMARAKASSFDYKGAEKKYGKNGARNKTAWDKEYDEFQRMRDDRIEKIARQIGYVTFDVPGDGRFKVVNTAEKLREFRAKVEKSPGFAKNPDRPSRFGGQGLAGAQSLDQQVADAKKFGGDPLADIGNAIEIARLKDGKDEDRLLDRFKEVSGGKDYDTWRAEQEAAEEIAAREAEAREQADQGDPQAFAQMMAMYDQPSEQAQQPESSKFKSSIAGVRQAYGDASAFLRGRIYSVGVDNQHKARLEARLVDAGLTKREASDVIASAQTLKAQETRGAGPMTFLQLKYVLRAASNRELIEPVDTDGRPVEVQQPEQPAQTPDAPPSAAEERAMEAELDRVPGNVQSRLSIALAALRETRDRLAGVMRARGKGQTLAIEVRDAQDEIARRRAVLDEFRAKASENDVDADLVIRALGGEPDFAEFGEPAAADAPAEAPAANQPALTGPRRNPAQVSAFTPYLAGDIVTIDGQDWQVQQDMSGWYLTSTGNWRGMHPTIQKIRGMNELIAEIEQAATAQAENNQTVPLTVENALRQIEKARSNGRDALYRELATIRGLSNSVFNGVAKAITGTYINNGVEWSQESLSSYIMRNPAAAQEATQGLIQPKADERAAKDDTLAGAFRNPATKKVVVTSNKATADAIANSKQLKGKATVRKATPTELTRDDLQRLGYDNGERLSLGYVVELNQPMQAQAESNEQTNATAKIEAQPAYRLTFDQWLEQQWAGNRYRDAYLENANGDERKAKYAAASGGGESEVSARGAYWAALMDAPRDADVSLEMYDGLTDAQKRDASRHFFKLDDLVRDRYQREAMQKKAQEDRIDREVIAPMQAEVDRLRSMNERTKSGTDAWNKRATDAANLEGLIADLRAGRITVQELPAKWRGEEERPAAENTSDAGEELTYNKRNRRTSGLKWEDVSDKNAALRIKEVVKAKVYPKPDYAALVEGGMQPIVAHIVKQAYDAIAPAPKLGRSQGATPSDEVLQSYIGAVNRVMEGVLKWANDPEALGQWAARQSRLTGIGVAAANPLEQKTLLGMIYPNGWKDSRDEIIMLGGNKFLGALQPGYDEVRRAMKDVDKGWPSKLEAWQKQGYKIADGAGLSISYYEGRRRGETPFVSIIAQVGNDRILVEAVEGAESRNDASVKASADALTARLAGKQLLLDKRGNLVSAHETIEAAQEAAREQTKREQAGDEISEKGISVEMAERVGAERRMPGEDISSERIMETFGFRGINFGNWMKGDTPAKVRERQLHLNHLYDAFLDLAEILNVPPKAMSLNGMLGIAVGAQGSGKHLAHFVPGVNEINITRTAGAGALAHEWGHALDHYFARQAGLERNTAPFLTEHVGRMEGRVEGSKYVRAEKALDDGLRPEIAERFKAIVEAMERRDETQEEYRERMAASVVTTGRMAASEVESVKEDLRKAIKGTTGSGIDAALEKIDAAGKRIAEGDVGEGAVAWRGDETVLPVVREIMDVFETTTGRPMADKAVYSLQYMTQRHATIKGIAEAADRFEPRKVPTNYKSESNAADAKKKPYWATRLEMFARAFDAYVVDSLDKKAAKNTYLSGIEAVPPRGDERKIIGEAFDALVGEMRTRETEQGVALFRAGDPMPDTITVDGIERPTANSEGRPIHPSVEGVRNFWRWFGESAVTDDQGRPLVTYHGTTEDVADGVLRPGEDAWSDGIFFTDSAQIAASVYARGTFTPNTAGVREALARMSDAQLEDFAERLRSRAGWGDFWLEIDEPAFRQPYADQIAEYADNTFDHFEGGTQAIDTLAAELGINARMPAEGANVMPSYLSLQDPMMVDGSGLEFDSEQQAEWIAQAKAAGHDGLVIRNYSDGGFGIGNDFRSAGRHDVFVAFQPEQAKSATGNSGDFSASPSVSLRTANEENLRVGFSRVDADRFIEDFLAATPNAPEIVAVNTFDQLPAFVQQEARNQGETEKTVKGVLVQQDGVTRVYVVVGNHASLTDFEATVFHEVAGHFGMREMLGPDFTQKLNQIYLGIGGQGGLVKIMNARGLGWQAQSYIRGIQRAQRTDADNARKAAAMGRKYRIRWTDAVAKAVLTEEVYAHIAEQLKDRPGLLDKFKALIGALRQWLRDHTFMRLASLGETDLLYMLSKARKELQGPSGGPKGGRRTKILVSDRETLDRDGERLDRADPDLASAMMLARGLGLQERDGVAVFAEQSDQDAAPGGSESQSVVFRVGDSATIPRDERRDYLAGAASRNDSPLRQFFTDLFAAFKSPSSKVFGPLHKRISTQLHKAWVNKDYGEVFYLADRYERDISRFSAEPSALAPKLLPTFDKIGDAFDRMLKGDKVARMSDKVANAIFEGTLAGATPTEGRVWTDQELRDRFELDDAQIELYREARKTADLSLDISAAGLAWQMVKKYIGDLKEAVRTAPADAAKTIELSMRELEDQLREEVQMVDGMIADAENEGEAAKLAANRSKLMRKAQEVAEARIAAEGVFKRAEDLKAGGYFPLMRFGKYNVDVTIQNEDGETERLGFYKFETEAEAKMAEQRLRREFPEANIERSISSEEAWKVYQGVDPETVALFAEHIGSLEGLDVKDDVLQAWYREAVNNRSAFKRMIHRKGTEGFDRDLTRVLASFVTSNARLAARQFNMPDIAQKIADLKQRKAPGDVVDEAERLRGYIENPEEPFQSLKGWMFAWFLGGSISSALLNATQPFMVTLPYLSQFGATQAAAELTKAMKGGASGKVTDADLQKALLRAAEDGKVDPQQVHHLFHEGMRPFISKLPFGQNMRARAQGLMTAWGYLFGWVENFNRRSTFIAAYRMAKANPKLGDAYEFAVRAVDETQGIYGKSNRANWARGVGPFGGLGVAAFVFKQYSIAYVELLIRMAKSGPAGKRAALMQLGILVMLAGLQGLPGADDLEDLIDTAAQHMGYTGNSRLELHRYLKRVLGEEFGNIVQHGLLSAPMLRGDMSSRVGLGDLFPATAIFKPSQQNRASQIAELFGPPASMGEAVMKALDASDAGGGALGILKALTPVAVSNAWKGVDMAVTGRYNDTRGRKVVEVDMLDAVLKGVGIQPSKINAEQRPARLIQLSAQRVRQVKSNIHNLRAQAIVEKNADKRRRADEMLRDWNAKNPDARLSINSAAILRRVKEMNAERRARLMKTLPKELRQSAAEEYAQ